MTTYYLTDSATEVFAAVSREPEPFAIEPAHSSRLAALGRELLTLAMTVPLTLLLVLVFAGVRVEALFALLGLA